MAGKSFQGAVLGDRVGICRSYLSTKQGNKVALTPAYACLSYCMDHSVPHGSWGLCFLSCKLRKQSRSACPDWLQRGHMRQGVCKSFVNGDVFFSFVNGGMCSVKVEVCVCMCREKLSIFACVCQHVPDCTFMSTQGRKALASP